MENTTREQGTIIVLASSKGYGFIRRDKPEGGNIFFHANGYMADFTELREGMRVEYTPIETDKGRHLGKIRAIGVELLGSSGGMVVV